MICIYYLHIVYDLLFTLIYIFLDSGTAHDARDPSLVFTTEGEEKYCEKVCLKHTNWSQRQPLLTKLQISEQFTCAKVHLPKTYLLRRENCNSKI